MHMRLRFTALTLFFLGTISVAVLIPELWATEPLRVGIFQNKPIVYFDNGPKGLFVEVMDHVARQEHLDITYIRCELKDCLEMLKANKLDLMTSLGEDPRRLDDFIFSKEPVWTFWGTVYANDNRINTLFDLKGKTIGVRRKNKITAAIKELISKFEIPVQFVEFDNYEMAFEELENRSIDAVAANNSYTFSEFKGKAGFHKTGIVYTPFSAYFAVSKIGGNPDLLKTIDTHVKELRTTPASLFTRFNERWFGRSEAFWTTPRVVAAMGTSVFVIFLVMAFWRFQTLARLNARLKQTIANQEQTEACLKNSEQRFRRVFENPHSVMLIIEAETGRILDANPAAQAFYGWRRDELLQMNIREINNLDKTGYRQLMDKAKEEEKSFFTLTHQLKNGEKRDVEVHTGPIEMDGKLVLFSIVHDITDRVRMEKQLRPLFEKAADAIFVGRMDGSLVQVNEQACKVTGYTEEQLLTMNVMDVDAHHNSIDRFSGFVSGLAPGQGITIESDHVRKDGTVFPVEITINILDIPGGPFVMGLARDITARKQAEQAVRESEKKYRSMLESMDDPIYICSEDFRVIYMNPAMEVMTGYKEKEAVGTPCFNIIHGLEEECPWCRYREIQNGESVKSEFAAPRNRRIYDVSCSPIRQHDGSVYKLTVFRDITDIKKMEARIMQSQKMESIGNLAGGIAHDFNNLLFPIVGRAEMLLEDLPAQSAEHASAHEILVAGKRARDLVQRILSFSRQDDHQVQAVAFQDILEEVLTFSRSTIPSNIDIIEDIRKDCGGVMADPSLLHQVGMNLITNAFHAIDKTEGRIFIRLAETVLEPLEERDMIHGSGKYLVLTVADNGRGMPPEVMEKIFDPYFTTKEKGRGTGLGLSVVFGIVKEMNGEIKVHSEVGAGSEFTVYLPLAAESCSGEPPKIGERPEKGSERILLVDDEPAIVGLEAQILGRLGYKVDARLDSKDALAVFQENPMHYDLVITDMTMPGMTGDQFARAVLETRPGMPVIICTGFSEKMGQAEAEKMGIQGYLMKPVTGSDLAKTVRRVLDA